MSFIKHFSHEDDGLYKGHMKATFTKKPRGWWLPKKIPLAMEINKIRKI